MTAKRAKNRAAVDDPHKRACSACGARVDEACKTVGKNGKPLPRVPRASRLVHAARLEETGGDHG